MIQERDSTIMNLMLRNSETLKTKEYLIPNGILIISFVQFSTNIKSLTGLIILHPGGLRDWEKKFDETLE
ncbi:MAG: hypothetical protein WCS69_11955 [Ignavibacteriaceae bacterium]|jgi:hypothetical protein